MISLSKKYKLRSYALLILVILFVFRITLLIRTRDAGSYTSLDLFNLIQIGSVLILAVLLLKYKSLFVTFKKQSINYFIGLFLLGMISGIWSENFFYSSYRAFEAFVLFMACISILNYSSYDFKIIEKSFLRLILLVGVLSFLGLLARRSSISLAGLHNNSYTITGAIMASYCFGSLLGPEYYDNRKKILKRYFGFGLFLTIIGTSLGSFLSFLVAVVIIMALSPKKNKSFIFIMAAIIAVIVVGIVNADVIQDLILINKDAEEIEGLNGRTRLWEMYLEMIYERPFLGWGFDIIARSAEFYTTNTHFFLISILGGMGLLGIFVFFVGFIKLIFELFKYNRHKLPSRLGFMGGLAAAFINGGSKGYIGEHVYPETLSFLLLLIFFSICYQRLYLHAKQKP
ncbi:O-antigen ligase [Winogradskyella sp. KYW1333]|uniref:O-antigen ligase family protein n=1 Tax=Winogradskyella sp. KYW1333 TaxID=2282123 RepID=UPI000DF34563|nr:O-antigen ligase family protein [Winogradskyella sp. KYW1333]RCT55358.1 O-antigen ligase domain-containing protein [Winogradskyella sp. KYW1333]